MRFGVILLVFLIFASPQYAAGSWIDVTTDIQQINMQVPGMEHWNPGFWERTTTEVTNRGNAYFSKWRDIEDYGIHAQLTYQKRTHAFYYYFVREQVQLSLQDTYSATFTGKIKTYDSKTGDFDYVFFTVVAGEQARKCVGFSRMFSGNKKSRG